MSKRYFNDGQEVVMEDFNALSGALLREIYDRGFYELLQRIENAFFGDSFKIIFSNSNTVICKKGLGFQTDNAAVSPDVKRKPVVLDADESLNINSPDPTNNRIDIVCAKAALVNEITDIRNYKDASSGEVTPQSFVLQKDWEAELLVVDGTPAGSPVAPAVPAGYIKLAEIVVTAVTGVANSAAITDSRITVPIGGDTTLNTVGYGRLTAGASTKISSLFSQIDSIVTNAWMERANVTIANNQGSAQPTGITIDHTLFTAFKALCVVKINTASNHLATVLEVMGVYNNGAWEFITPPESGMDTEVVLSMNGDALEYKSGNIAGGSYTGTMTVQLTKIA